MAPEDFLLFPKLKLPLDGTRFQSVQDVKENSRRELNSIPEAAFKKCFVNWIIHWRKCIVTETNSICIIDLFPVLSQQSGKCRCNKTKHLLYQLIN
jgi:hypothetical protein